MAEQVGQEFHDLASMIEKEPVEHFREERGWIIERTSDTHYWSVLSADGILGWSQDHERAIRFCRESDAKAIMSMIVFQDNHAIVREHVWCHPK